jgi:hypothetical protein
VARRTGAEPRRPLDMTGPHAASPDARLEQAANGLLDRPRRVSCSGTRWEATPRPPASRPRRPAVRPPRPSRSRSRARGRPERGLPPLGETMPVTMAAIEHEPHSGGSAPQASPPVRGRAPVRPRRPPL